MKFLSPLLAVVFSLSFGALFADDVGGDSTSVGAKDRDDDALRDFIKTKRAISVKEKGGSLMISGDIRGEWYHMHCKTDGREERGWSSRNNYSNNQIDSPDDWYKWGKKEAKGKLETAETTVDTKEKARDKAETKYVEDKTKGLDKATLKADRKAIKSAKAEVSEAKRAKKGKSIWKQKADFFGKTDKRQPPQPKNEFDIEANLIFDYVADRGWGTIQLQFGNLAGLPEIDRKPLINDSRRMMYGSGSLKNITLRKAFAGYNIWQDGVQRLDIEVGRRRLYDAFDSKIEFYNYFDGVLLRYIAGFEGLFDFSAKAAVFDIDHTVNHYGKVGELAFLGVADTGVDFKYSLIDWDKSGPNRFGRLHARECRSMNSQFLVAYNIDPSLIQHKTKVYAAYLVNHKAERTGWTHHRKANEGFYVGATMGEVRKRGDWSWDLRYEMVQAQAIIGKDCGGICRDNPRGISFYNRRSGGWANYCGMRLDTFYALTDNWTINAQLENAHQQCWKIGRQHRSYQFFLKTIFAF